MRAATTAVLCALACATPAPTIASPAGAAVDVGGVRLAAAAATDLATDVRARATFVVVAVENAGRSPLPLRLADLALASDAGPRASALPPHPVDDGALPVDARFARERFLVAAESARLVPSVPVWRGALDVDPLFHAQAAEGWRKGPPPDDVRARMLPDGVLLPGGRVVGLVAFERMPDDVPRATLTWTLRGALVDVPVRLQ